MQTKLIALFVSLLLLVINGALAEQRNPAEEAETRWFEVEVILYKITSQDGLFEESWTESTRLNLPEDIIDFLQPLQEPLESKHVDSTELDQAALVEETVDNTSPTSKPLIFSKTNFKIGTIDDAKPSLLTSKTTDAILEEPFILLADEFLQLNSEAENIAKNNNYQLLAHYSWRQPVAGKNGAPTLRLAGGFDYKETFDYSGELKLDTLPENHDLEMSDENQFGKIDETEENHSLLAEPNTIGAEQESTNSVKSNLQNSNSSDNLPESNESLDAIPLPWVPEIDGSLIVYIHRNYLHVDTDLYFRRPDKHEVDMFDLTTQLPPLEQTTNFGPNQNGQSPLSSLQSGQSVFDWEYDSDFLSKETKKVFTERLFNYQLKQTRRLRSNELHYFDHPLIGLLVMIRPYEVNTLNSTEDTTENEGF